MSISDLRHGWPECMDVSDFCCETWSMSDSPVSCDCGLAARMDGSSVGSAAEGTTPSS